MNIAHWQEKVHALAEEKGWWDGVAKYDVSVIPEKIALIHSEASEGLEAYRDPPSCWDSAEAIYSRSMTNVYQDPDGERFSRPRREEVLTWP